MEYHFGTFGKWDFAKIVEQIPDFNFEKITRSTIVQLCFWKKAEDALSAILEKLDLKKESVKICFEHQVRPKVSRCKASFSDVMVFSDNDAVAIEGKRTEKMGERINSWIGNINKENKIEVLKFWCSLLSPFSNGLSFEKIHESNVYYQMLHRTASACHVACPVDCDDSTRKANVLYQLFAVDGDRNHPDYKKELTNLKKLICPKPKLKFWFQKIKGTPTDHYTNLHKQIEKLSDKKIIAESIRTAILSNELFSFDQLEFIEI